MGANLPPSHPRVTAAAHAAMIRANLFPYMGVSECSGNAQLGSTGGTKFRVAPTRYILLPMEVPAAAGEERRPYLGCLDCTACSRANCSARALFRMSAHSCEPIRKASSVAVSPSPLTMLTSAPFLSSRSTIFASPRAAAYMSGVAVLGDEVGVEVLGENLLGVDEVALLDGVEQHLDAFGALVLGLFLEARGEQ